LVRRGVWQWRAGGGGADAMVSNFVQHRIHQRRIFQIVPPHPRRPMEHFFNCRNIERHKHLLELETDPAKRALLLKLLAEEEAKQTKPRGRDLWLG
jgi:hypothetical protein